MRDLPKFAKKRPRENPPLEFDSFSTNTSLSIYKKHP